jgi:Lon protease-like protein
MSDSAGERWEILPTLTLLRGVLFPGARCCVQLETLEAYGAVVEATRSWGQKAIAVLAARAGHIGGSVVVAPFQVGAAAEVLTLQKHPGCQRWVAELRALERLRICEHLRRHPFRIARIERMTDPAEDPYLLRGLVEALRDAGRRLAALPLACVDAERASSLLAGTTDPVEALGHAMDMLPELSVDEQQATLELPLLSARLAFAVSRLHVRLRPPYRRQSLLH